MLLCVSLSLAAEVTEIPPFLRGDLSVGYGFNVQQGSLQESDGVGGVVGVGTATTEEHRLDIGASFGVAPGVAVNVVVPNYLVARYSWSDANEMVYDPNRETGSMSYGSPIGETVLREGAGTGGVWIGLRATPFSETWIKTRGNTGTLAVDLALRTRDSSNIYTGSEGSYGAGNGGFGKYAALAFSTTLGSAQPWLRVSALSQGTTDNGSMVVTNPNVVNLASGVEVRTFSNPTSGAWFALDLRLGYTYNSWSEVPSGVWLPSVMSSTAGKPVVMGENSVPTAGLGFRWQLFKYARLDLGADVGWVMPYQVESPYLVKTGADTIRVTGGGKLTVTLR